jgi:hypothetical protein
LPEVLPDSIEVFSNTEKVYTNNPDTLINSAFLSLPASLVADSSDTWQIQQKAELNTSNVPWKYLAKTLFESITEERKEKGLDIPIELGQFNGEENTEFQVFDSGSRQKKREIVNKKARTCFSGQPITVKFYMRNPLKIDITITHIKLVCKFEDLDEVNEECYVFEKQLELKELETKEVITLIIPLKTGKLSISHIEWMLFDLVYCQFNLLLPSQVGFSEEHQAKQADSALYSGVNEIHPLLRDKKNQFVFNVTDESGELEVKPEVGMDSCLFTEYTSCKVAIKNLSLNYPIKNCYMICSHPLLFGVEKEKIF